MHALDAASLATRPRKDHSLTPTRLAERWEVEGRAVGLESTAAVEAAVTQRREQAPELTPDDVFATLLDPETGLCANSARFTQAHVVERICAASAGRLTTGEILRLAGDFLASEYVVRLVPDTEPTRRRPPEWSTVVHRALENAVLDRLGQLVATPAAALHAQLVDAAVVAEARLGSDQSNAVRELCGAGSALRSLIAPAGFGKTTAVHAAAAACTAGGRPVLGVATTNQAVAGLRGVGLEAVTIARLRLDLDKRPLAPGTVVVLDEVSQVATRDAAVVLDAVAATPGAQLWCLGDPRQAQSVGAGGLAAELSRLGADGAIVAPALSVNRRQRHAEDRRALAELRAGQAAASQAVRTEAGWEHEEATPLATREALADAVVADIATFGPDAVATLAVSHADCEDLADRIRSRLLDAGHISGDAMAGPGWGSGERSYAQGDRVLLHTKPGHDGLHNGSTGTVVGVGSDGLAVAFDDHGGDVVLRADFVAGRRGDGNPNLSHAWARTIDGAQGGTWEAAHLLGSGSLDALVGYTGQSRGMAPTHTWNTRPLAVVDGGGLAADDRSATEVVLAGLSREPVTTFAAADDPLVLHRRLSAERAEHLAVLASAPPHLRAALQAARSAAGCAARSLEEATGDLERAEAHLAGFGPLSGLRRSVRSERSQAEHAVARNRDRLDRVRTERREAEHRVVDLEAGEATRLAFAAETSWRLERVLAIDADLDRHWATATLAAVRQDDPLAFGIERLRAARATHLADLARLNGGVPSDRSADLGEAQRTLAAAEQELRQAAAELAACRDQLEMAGERRWARRDKSALIGASAAVERAEQAMAAAVHAEHAARSRLDADVSTERGRAKALAATEPRRVELNEALAELDAALDDTRPTRVAALSAHAIVPAHLVAVLGEPPTQARPRQVWCELAGRVESYRDRHPEAIGHESEGGVTAAIGPRPAEQWTPDPEWDDLAGKLRRGAELVSAAADVSAPGDDASWVELLDDAVALLEAQRATPDRGLDHDHGMGIGW